MPPASPNCCASEPRPDPEKLLGVYICHFASVLPGHPADVLPRQIGLFFSLTVLLVIVQAAGAVLLIPGDAIGGRIRGAHQTGERDRLIELRASRHRRRLHRG